MSAGSINTSWAMPYPYGRGNQTHAPQTSSKTLACPHCHQTIPWQDLQEAFKESSLLACLTLRLARKGGRDLIGYSLDKVIPLPKKFKNRVSRLVKKPTLYFEKEYWDYNIVFQKLKKGSRLSLIEFFKKTILHSRLWSLLYRYYEGQIFAGLTRTILLLITCYDVAQYAYKANKFPEQKDQNLKLCVRQAIKWTIGTEIGNIGFDLGKTLAPAIHFRAYAGVLMEVLWSGLFDKWLNNYVSLEHHLLSPSSHHYQT